MAEQEHQEEPSHFHHALTSNASWASYKSHQNPSFFPRLATGQSPTILWLGCSDSRVPETTVLGLQPGDVFVHRNIANIVSPTDINSSAVIEYAVAHLGVKHVVLCGHTACGGAKAALGGSKVGGVLDTWLTPLRQMCRSQAKEIEAAGDEDARAVKLAELNVKRGVDILMDHMVIQEHIEKRGLQVHGVIFDLESGKLRDLGIGNGKKMGTDDGGLEGSLVRGKHGVLHFEDDGAVMKAAAKTEL